MARLPTAIYTAQQVRELDRHAIERLHTPGYELMTRAGSAAFKLLQSRWPSAKRIAIVCGSGNNAGDGYVVARLARQAGLKVTTIALSDPTALRGDAAHAYRDFVAAGGGAIAWLDSAIAEADCIVDAIFGTGLSRAIDADLCLKIAAMNRAAAPILALDLPSGLHADSGAVMGAAVKATCTLTFVGLKLGCYVGVGPEHCGALCLDSLQIPELRLFDPVAERLDETWLRGVLPHRSRLAHKGVNGHVLIIGGGIGMAGAARLAGEAALRAGAGWVTVASRPENVAAIVSDRPELIVRGVDGANDLALLMERADVVAIGPGLGQDEWSRALWRAAVVSERPKVVDADALNLLAQQPMRREDWILTPHPGEAARLLGKTSALIQADRFASAQALVRQFGGVAVLKGAMSLIAREHAPVGICDKGNPAMATPGMGDVLTGVIAGLLAQTRDLFAAARMGVVAHAWAGDLAAARFGAKTERGVIASDLFAELPRCLNAQE